MFYIKETKKTSKYNPGTWITFWIEKKQCYKVQCYKGQCTIFALIQARKDEFGAKVLAMEEVNIEYMLENSIVFMLNFLNLITIMRLYKKIFLYLEDPC